MIDNVFSTSNPYKNTSQICRYFKLFLLSDKSEKEKVNDPLLIGQVKKGDERRVAEVVVR